MHHEDWSDKATPCCEADVRWDAAENDGGDHGGHTVLFQTVTLSCDDCGREVQEEELLGRWEVGA